MIDRYCSPDRVMVSYAVLFPVQYYHAMHVPFMAFTTSVVASLLHEQSFTLTCSVNFDIWWRAKIDDLVQQLLYQSCPERVSERTSR